MRQLESVGGSTYARNVSWDSSACPHRGCEVLLRIALEVLGRPKDEDLRQHAVKLYTRYILHFPTQAHPVGVFVFQPTLLLYFVSYPISTVPIFDGHQSHVVHCPPQELTAEMLASAAYDTSVLAEGQGCHDYLERLATHAGDHLDVCAQVPEEAFRGSKAPDISMWGTTSLGSFVEVVRNVKIDCVVHVVYKYTDRPVGHIVVVGPDGFQLCTCLRLMRCGLHCSHTLAALVTKLGRAEEFLGESIHPRWRTSLEPWSLYSAGLSPFDGHERGTYTDGFTGDYGDMDLEDSQDGPAGGAVSIPRGRFYADFFARVTKLVSAASDNYDGTPASYARYNELFDRFGRDVNATIMAPVVADGVTGLGNPPLPVSKTRKETRHKDGFEGRPKKKAKGGDTTSCVDVAN